MVKWTVPRCSSTRCNAIPDTKLYTAPSYDRSRLHCRHRAVTVMASQQPSDAPPSKRRKLDDDSSSREVTKSDHHAGLNKPISPPLPRRKSPEPPSFTPTWSFDGVPKPALASGPAKPATPHHDGDRTGEPRYCPSPIQLTKIEKLQAHQNVDAVCLSDLLGDPLIKECWNFNFLFDLDFVM